MTAPSGRTDQAAPSPTGSVDWVVALPLQEPDRPQLFGCEARERSSLAIVFRGLLHDRASLAKRLDLPDGTPSDALVLAAYERDGDTAFVDLRGAFAFVIVDRARRCAWAVRDPIGLHPLYFLEAGGVLFVGSEPHALFAAAGRRRRPNSLALADHLCHRWPDPAETYLEGLHRVLPGARLRHDPAGYRQEKYWNPAPADRPVAWLTADELGSFDELFDQAVERSVLGTSPAIFLSGGLDSIAVAAAATDLQRRRGLRLPIALSLIFPDPNCDESEVQVAVARQLGLAQHIITFDQALAGRGLFALALESSRGSPFPVINAWGPAYTALALLGRQDGARAILTGTGGDEWLSVSPYLAADLLRAGDLRGFLRLFSANRRSFKIPAWHVARRSVWSYGLRPLAGATLAGIDRARWDQRRLNRLVSADPPWLTSNLTFRQTLRRRARACVPDPNPPGGFYLREARTGLDHALVSMELEDRHSLATRLGLQFTHPFWDADLVDMLLRTPPLLLLRGGRSKGLVREALARRFPELGFTRQRKVAATSFFRSRLAAEGPELMTELGGFEALADLGVIEPAVAHSFVTEALANPGAPLHRVWDLLNLEHWVRSILS